MSGHSRPRVFLALMLTLILMLGALDFPVAAADPVPVPPSVGADVPATYFGPPPSEVQKELFGPVKLLRAGTIDMEAGTITLPLYLGKLKDGRNVWYILTDTDDKGNADQLGLNWAPKLTYAAVDGGTRNGHLQNDTTLVFDKGAVDFSPVREVVPGDAPNLFPPKTAKPGSIGDADYTPLVRIDNAGGHIYDAPMVAFNVDASQINFCNGNVDYTKVHDRVVKICPEGGANGAGTVTLKTTPIFSFGKPVLYISTESSDPVPATLDEATFAPSMGKIQVGRDDSAFSAIERLFVTTNGPVGIDNPQRQGLFSALSDKTAKGTPAPPLHVIGAIPTVGLDYSPLWDLNLGEWTQDAVAKGYRSRLIDEFQYLSMVQQGFITGPGGKKYGSTGIIVNCPIVARLL